jgi:ribosomal-protein-alanine N-acetyltransferase
VGRPDDRSAAVVRLATDDDLGGMLALERALFSPLDRFPAAVYRGFLRRDPTCVLVAALDGRVVGCAAGGVERRAGHVFTLGVAAEARGRGLGRALAARLLDALAAAGARSASLEVRAGNAPAIALYRSLGFVDAGRLIAYYPDGEDGLQMERRL